MFSLLNLGQNSSASFNYYPGDREQYYEDEFSSSDDTYVPEFRDLYEFADEIQVAGYINEWRLMLQQNKPEDHVKAWFENIKLHIRPQIVGHRSCLMHHKHIMRLDRSKSRHSGVMDCGTSYPDDYGYNSYPQIECAK